MVRVGCLAEQLRTLTECNTNSVIVTFESSLTLARLKPRQVERNKGVDELALVGVRTRGVHLARRLKESGYGSRPVSGQGQGDWVLVDAGDVIVHLFRPEVRDYYDLEGMWSVGGRK